MIKTVLLDVDGVIVKLRDKYFSDGLIENNPRLDADAIRHFYKNQFLLCETGQLDLKEELAKQLPLWRYQGTVESYMKIWFEGEAELVPEVVALIRDLRKQGIKVFLATNNEKYRVDYLLNVVGIKDFIDGCFGSATIGYLKSQPEFWTQTHTRLNNPAKDTVLVWDNTAAIVDSAKMFGYNAEIYKNFVSFKKIMDDILITSDH